MAEQKISVKLLVDTKANKVLYAEAERQFVDFLFYILSLPVGKVGSILTAGNASVGCICDLSKSFGNLSAEYFSDNFNQTAVLALKPKFSINVNPLGQFMGIEPGVGFGLRLMEAGVAGTYMVTDNLEVKPMSTAAAFSLINESRVKDLDSLTFKDAELGSAEALELVKATMQSREVLTTVFLCNDKVKSEGN